MSYEYLTNITKAYIAGKAVDLISKLEFGDCHAKP